MITICLGKSHCVLHVILQQQPKQALQPHSWLDSISSWLVADALQHVASIMQAQCASQHCLHKGIAAGSLRPSLALRALSALR